MSTTRSPASDVTIRHARPDDFDRWLPLWQGYNAFYGRSGPTALDPAITEQTWARFFDPTEPMFVLVAERGDALIGITHCLYHRSTIHSAHTCYLQDLFTAESARGQGVGRALIEAAASIARGAGAARLYWLTHESNHRAMALYDTVAEKSGFLVYRKGL